MIVTPKLVSDFDKIRGKGSHSESEIPEEVEKLRLQHPTIEIQYARPFCMNNFAEFLGKHVESFNAESVLNSN